MSRLAPEGRWLRWGLAAAILLALIFLALPLPERGPPLLPCGFHAVSGLPCLFCGGTRAARAILHGNLQAALYLNALAFPALALAVAASLVLLVEAAAARPLAPWEAYLRRLSRLAPVLVLPALAWWMVHLYFALRTPKPELVDFRNPIAAGAEALVLRTLHSPAHDRIR
ncbi:MAG: DUF2752 domain-containing protein [Verrucomicrobiota bacterium]